VAKSGSPSKPGPRVSPASQDTRDMLVAATIDTLKHDGMAGASARAIAGRAGCNQALVFYHFGSVANLLLAALDSVSTARRQRYESAIAQARSPSQLARVAEEIFREDLDAGYATVLAELVSGASSIPGLAEWIEFARAAVSKATGSKGVAAMVPASEVAYGVVAMYLGLEMLSHLDGNQTKALQLFQRAQQLIAMAETFGLLSNADIEDAP
jgi:AcrR family transcriptional regulator